MQDYALELLRDVDAATPLLLAIDDERNARRLAPGTSPRDWLRWPSR